MGAQRPDLFSYSRLWRLNRQKKKKRFVLLCPCIAPYLGRNFQQVVVIWEFSSYEFSYAELENIGLSAIKQGPRCAPNTQSRKAQYFRFVRHTFVTNKVIKHEK